VRVHNTIVSEYVAGHAPADVISRSIVAKLRYDKQQSRHASSLSLKLHIAVARVTLVTDLSVVDGYYILGREHQRSVNYCASFRKIISTISILLV